jgi:hypothetical protein
MRAMHATRIRQRFVDPTVAQYPAVAWLALGPIVGRVQAVKGPQGAVAAIPRDRACHLARTSALEALRTPSAIQRARTAPYPRVAALLDAIGNSPSETDADGNWF